MTFAVDGFQDETHTTFEMSIPNLLLAFTGPITILIGLGLYKLALMASLPPPLAGIFGMFGGVSGGFGIILRLSLFKEK